MTIKLGLQARLIMAFAWVVLLIGCGYSPPSNFYLLQSMPGIAKVKQTSSLGSGLALCVGPVILPKYLDRPQIVTITRTSEVKLASFHRWAEPLQDNFTGVLAENLSLLLGTDRIIVFPRESAASSDYQIRVTVIRLDGESGGNVVLSARWSIFGKGGKQELGSKKTDITEPTGAEGYEALVSAQSRAVAGLSKEIAGAIKALGEGKAP
jgi:uncharacterized lipoprotein YmbA